MKKIEFGFANEKKPTGSWQGTGINEQLAVTDAEYYGAVKFDGNSYIIAKVTEDRYGHWPNLVGKFIVRPAVANVYDDGSGIMFLDQEQSLRGRQIENFLNNPQFKDKIRNLDDIVNFIKNGISKNNEPFDACTIMDSYVATSIKHEEFEKIKKEVEIKEQLKKDEQLLSQSYPQEVVDRMLETRKKGLVELAEIEEFANRLKSPAEKKYGYLNKEQVDEIKQTGQLPVTYETRKNKLLAAIEQDKITWEDKDYIREDLLADNDIKFALDHQANKSTYNDIENSEEVKYSPETQALLEAGQSILNQTELPELSPDNSVDQNLEIYTKLEQSINQNPNLSEQEKQGLRNAIWTDFDNYVEQNPEQGKHR